MFNKLDKTKLKHTCKDLDLLKLSLSIGLVHVEEICMFSFYLSLGFPLFCLIQESLLAPTGALILMMVYYISIHPGHFFQIFTQSIIAIDVTSVTLSCLNSINAIDVTRC